MSMLSFLLVLLAALAHALWNFLAKRAAEAGCVLLTAGVVALALP